MCMIDFGYTPEVLLNNLAILEHRSGDGSTPWC